MSTVDIVEYYSNLLIFQYSNKPKAVATIKATVTPIIMDQLPLTVQDAFDLDTAIGYQLDTIAKYVGVSRSGNGFNGPITLDDSDFLALIKLGIIRNNFGSSLSTIQDFLATYFLNEILVFDYANMHINYLISSAVGSQNLAQLFITEGLLPKPMGVGLGTLIYAPIINTFFGFRTYDIAAHNTTPFNTYDSYNMSSPWLTYDQGLVQ